MSSDLDKKDNQIPGVYDFLSHILDVTLKKTNDDLKNQGIQEALKSIIKKKNNDMYYHYLFEKSKLMFKNNLTEIFSSFIDDILKELYET